MLSNKVLKSRTLIVYCNLNFVLSLIENVDVGNFENDVDRHPCVRATLVEATHKNQADLMHIVARLNKYCNIRIVR